MTAHVEQFDAAERAAIEGRPMPAHVLRPIEELRMARALVLCRDALLAKGPPFDDNDLAIIGELPDDPSDDTEFVCECPDGTKIYRSVRR